MWRHPRQRAEVAADLVANVPIAFEEMLRYGAPAQWFSRTVVDSPYTLRGHTLDRQPARNEVPPSMSCMGVNQWPNSLGATDYTGRLFRVSDTGFTSLTNSGTASGTGPHADSRAGV